MHHSVDTLPGWPAAASLLSPATYLLRSVRDAAIAGATVTDVAGDLAILAGFVAVLVPGSVAVFSAAERWAKRTGRLKRQG